MKALFLVAVMCFGLAGVVDGREIQADINERDGKTIISCMVNGHDIDIRKAQIFLYVSNGVEFATGLQEMEVSYENVASYELPGTYDAIEGKCKLIMLGEDKKVAREEFAVVMR